MKTLLVVIASVFMFTCGGSAYSVRPDRDPSESFAVRFSQNQARDAACERIASQRRAWQATSVGLGALVAAVTPAIVAIPATDDGLRLAFTIGISIGSGASAGAAAIAGVEQEAFSASCAQSSSGSSVSP